MTDAQRILLKSIPLWGFTRTNFLTLLPFYAYEKIKTNYIVRKLRKGEFLAVKREGNLRISYSEREKICNRILSDNSVWNAINADYDFNCETFSREIDPMFMYFLRLE